jgi:exoribonuclease R
VTAPTVRAPVTAAPFPAALGRIRDEFHVPAEFPAEVAAEASEVARRGPLSPPGSEQLTRADRRGIEFLTIDPPGTLDLDQAFWAEARGEGFRVYYAIADVAAFVAPGGALDTESFARGVTLYLPDGRAPMLPNTIGQDCASLLPDKERPALMWTFELDASGVCTSAHLERATVRSRAALDYPSVQQQLDAGTADEPLQLLRRIGELRVTLEAERGGVSLNLPTQEVTATGDGFTLAYEAPLAVERWNAQISLLAGMEAARLMIETGVGIVRTVPPPRTEQVQRLQRSAAALGVAWPDGARWSDVVRGLDRATPPDAAFLVQAAHLLRGAGYAKLDATNTADPSAVPLHAGVAAPYAHVTAPLRRLADRYANEIVLTHCAHREPPAWAVEALDRLVEAMETATRRAADIEHAVVDASECAILASHVGESFEGVVVDTNERGVIVQLTQPAVVASVAEQLRLGDRVTVVLDAVDPVARRVRLVLAPTRPT